MSDQDWVQCFDEAYANAIVHGTGFIKITANSPKGLELSVVDPRDYRYIEPIDAGQWGASSVQRPEYVAEQEAKTKTLRSLLDQTKEKNT